MQHNILALGFFFLTLAGCLSTPTDGDGSILEPKTNYLQGIELSDCQSWTAVANVDPVTAIAFSAPPGWEDDSTSTEIAMLMVVKCSRIHTGNLERGPIYLTLDLHSNIRAPNECRNAENSRLRAVNSFEVSDSTVAKHLSEQLGISVETITITHEKREVGVTSDEFQWGSASSSTRVVFHDSDLLENSGSLSLNFVVWNENEIFVLRWTEQFVVSNPQVSFAETYLPGKYSANNVFIRDGLISHKSDIATKLSNFEVDGCDSLD